MDESDSFILFLVGVVVAAALFFGIVHAVKKSFQKEPEYNPNPAVLDSRQKAQEVREQLESLKDYREDRLRDSQRMRLPR